MRYFNLVSLILVTLSLTACGKPCGNHSHMTCAQSDQISSDSTESKSDLPNRRLATGFFVTDQGHFITNHHVTNGAKNIYITTNKGQRVYAKVIKENPDIDIVIAKADIQSKGVSLGTQKSVEKGEEVLTLGYPLLVIQGSEQKATFGRINAFSGIRGDQKVYQIDVPLQPGNSGGPLISEHGIVIGVVKATFNQLTALQTLGTFTQNINYAVKSDQILPMLHQALGSGLKISNGSSHQQEMSDLVNKFENAVVLVEAF